MSNIGFIGVVNIERRMTQGLEILDLSLGILEFPKFIAQKQLAQ